MGNRLNRENLQLQQLLNRFELLQKLPDKNISFLEDRQTQKEFVLKELTFNEQKQFNRQVEKLLVKKKAWEGQPHVVQLSQYLVRTEDQYCSTYYKIYALFEHPFKSLQDEMHERQLQNRRFQEKELWSILASCILGLAHLQSTDIKHQCLRSAAILLTNDGLIKVADPYCTNQPTNFQLLLTKRSTPHLYISPQLCQVLAQEQTSLPMQGNPYKSDVFTVAMIILEAGLLQFQDQCYRDEYSRVHWDTLHYNLQRFGDLYTPELKTTLESMLHQAQEDRPEWLDLKQHVKVSDDAEPERVRTPVSARYGSTKRLSEVGNQAFHQVLSQQTLQQQAISQVTNIAQAPTHQQRQSALQVAHQNIHTNVEQKAPVSYVQSNFPQVPPLTQHLSPQHSTNIVQPFSQPSRQQPISLNNTKQTKKMTPQKQSQLSSPVQSNLVNPIPAIRKNPVSHGVPTMPSLIDEVKPIKASGVENLRPRLLMSLPTNHYITKVKNDENLVEVYDGDDERPRTVRESERADLQTQASHRSTLPEATQKQFSSTRQTPTAIVVNQTVNYKQNIGNPLVSGTYQGFIKNFPEIPQVVTSQYQPSYQTPTSFFQSSYVPGTFQTNMYSKTATFGPSLNDPKIEQRLIEKPVQQTPTFVVEVFKQGSRYEGQKLNGMRHGNGRFYYQDGGLYDGEWRDNKMSGRGKLFYQSGKIAYDGQWSNDQFTGFGILYNEDPIPLAEPYDYGNLDDIQDYWTRFEGQFQDDLKHGKGKLYLSNRQWFEGMFIKDAVSGPGVYHTCKGQIVSGIWNMNRLQRRTN